MLLIVLGRAVVARRPEDRLVSAGFEVLLVLVIFLGLLAAGMAIPFAIGVPAIVYLLVHGGMPALRGIGLMSWGSMNSFALTAIPLFILMAEIMQHSGLSFRIYRGLSQAGLRHPGRPAADQHRRLRAVRGDLRLLGGDGGGHRHGGPAAAHPARLSPAAGGGLAGGGRHARHPDPALDRHDRLRHLHRDLGVQAVHGRHRAGPAADGAVHGLRAGACAAAARDRAAREGAAEPRRVRRGAGRPAAVRRRHRRHHGQPLFRLGDAHRGRRHRLPGRRRRLGDLGQARLAGAQGGHDLLGDDQRQHPADRLYRLRVFLCHQRRRRGRAADHLDGRAQSLAARILLRPVHPLHDPGLPGRKPGHDRDHRAAALSGAAEIRHRSGVVRHHPGAVHRARADLAADRHQPVRDPEHLGRQAVATSSGARSRSIS